MIKTILSIAFLLTGQFAIGQSFPQSTLTWQADQAIDIERSDTTAMKCSFKTIGASQFIWSQRNGTMNTTFQVTGVEGAWENVATQGSIRLTLLRNGKITHALFERTNEGIWVSMEFVSASASSHVRFRIVTIE